MILIGIIILLILLIICISAINSIMKENSLADELKIYEFGYKTNSFKILFIAGIHGNEPAGTYTLNNLIREGYFNKITEHSNLHITVIPEANTDGLINNTRYDHGKDLNRSFTEKFIKNTPDSKSSKILSHCLNSDFIVDFHEGWGFHKKNNKSMGSTIIPTQTEKAEIIAESILNKLNLYQKAQFPFTRDKDFVITYKKCCFANSALSCLMNKFNKDYIMIETTGQNNIQPLTLRENQVKIIIDTIIISFTKYKTKI